MALFPARERAPPSLPNTNEGIEVEDLRESTCREDFLNHCFGLTFFPDMDVMSFPPRFRSDGRQTRMRSLSPAKSFFFLDGDGLKEEVYLGRGL